MYSINICISGDMNTGKSSFVYFLQTSKIYDYYVSTIGVEFTSIPYIYCHNNNEYKFKFNIWDCSGNKKFRNICRYFYNKGQTFFLFYESSRYNTFLELENIYNYIERYGPSEKKYYLIGTKSNYGTNQSTLELSEIISFAKKINATYTNINLYKCDTIYTLLDFLCKQYLEKHNSNQDSMDSEMNTCCKICDNCCFNLLLSKCNRD